uniref:KIB1-4 beta-propeller domain-containing protein n=1 Tax=Leersia perrieri TaxID=77586 RepID=A0A0D9WR09_9ORYZ
MDDSATDWSGLPADILGLVFDLLECTDLRSAAVCSAWRKVFSDACRLNVCPRRQTPCLLYCTEVAGASAVGMYSLLEKREYTIPLPDPPISNRTWIGSSHGWLITADEKSDLILLNPITGEQISLPPDGTIPRVEDTPYAFDFLEYCDTVYKKAMLSSDPSSGDCIVMLIHHPYSQISFARVGEDHWNWIPIGISYADCIYREGWFYTVNFAGAVDAFNLNGPSVIHKRILKDMLKLMNEQMYIVQSPGGDILVIDRTTIIPQGPEIEETEMYTSEIEVYKADFGEHKHVKLTSIGDYALFIGHTTSSCLPVKDYHMLMPNHVYITDDDYLWLLGFRDKRQDVGIYSLENNSLSNVVSPEPWKSWLPPIWMMPNLVKKGSRINKMGETSKS